jgi:hypothetical protein
MPFAGYQGYESTRICIRNLNLRVFSSISTQNQGCCGCRFNTAHRTQDTRDGTLLTRHLDLQFNTLTGGVDFTIPSERKDHTRPFVAFIHVREPSQPEVSEEIRSSMRYQTLMAFTNITGIGSTTAQKLYDLGLRTLHDLTVYADVDDLDDNQLAIVPSGGRSYGAKRLTWPESLKILEDLETK